jgi:hypothetical protein
MMKLPMTSSLPTQKPAVILKHLEDFSNRHDPQRSPTIPWVDESKLS